MNLETLAASLYEAKQKENAAREARIVAEEALAEHLECPLDGSKSHKIGDWKASVKRPINRRLDKAIWFEIESTIPEELRPVSYEPKLDDKGCKWLEKNEPELWARMARAVTSKPGKVAVTVEKKK